LSEVRCADVCKYCLFLAAYLWIFQHYTSHKTHSFACGYLSDAQFTFPEKFECCIYFHCLSQFVGRPEERGILTEAITDTGDSFAYHSLTGHLHSEIIFSFAKLKTKSIVNVGALHQYLQLSGLQNSASAANRR